jgi:hypothetical protein
VLLNANPARQIVIVIGPTSPLTASRATAKRRSGAVVSEACCGCGAWKGARYLPAEVGPKGLLKSPSADSSSNEPASAPVSRPIGVSPHATAASGILPHGQSTSGGEISTVDALADLPQPNNIRVTIPPALIISFPATTVEVRIPRQLSCRSAVFEVGCRGWRNTE